MKPTIAALLLGGLAVVCTGCDNGSSSSDSTPTAPTTALVTENFTGTVDPGGAASNPFTVAASGGQVNVTLTAAGPPTTIYMGLGVGTWTASSSTCTLLTNGYTLTPAGTTAQLSGTVNAGAYCVQIFDAGNQTAQITYAVTVTHY